MAQEDEEDEEGDDDMNDDSEEEEEEEEEEDYTATLSPPSSCVRDQLRRSHRFGKQCNKQLHLFAMWVRHCDFCLIVKSLSLSSLTGS